MIRSKRPLLGRLTRLALTTSLAISTLACAKKEVEDSWQMTPPDFEIAGTTGTRLQLKSSEIIKTSAAMNSLVGDEDAAIHFAPTDRGFRLDSDSTCRNSSGVDVSSHSTLQTAETVALISLVPPLTLTPDGIKNTWTCAFKLRVTNTLGSSHTFSVGGVKMNFAASLPRIQSELIDGATDSMGIRSSYPRRLICSTWWTDSVNGSLAAMARDPKVFGTDTRLNDRQPLCTVIELSPKARLAGYFRPVFPNPRFSIQQKIALVAGELPQLFHQPLMSWTIRNEESGDQVYFVANEHMQLRISGLFYRNPTTKSWSKPAKAHARLSVEGASQIRQTASGLYFRIAGGAVARLVLQSNRGPRVYSRFDFSRLTYFIALTTEAPLELRTIANPTAIAPLDSADALVLDNSRRDSFRPERDSLLSFAVLEKDSASSFLKVSNLTPQIAAALGPVMDFTMCLDNNIACVD